MTDLAAALVAKATATGKTVGTAESCTGGLIAAALTDVPGASAVFTYGVVAYANAAKTGLLGVDPALIEDHGAVSEEVARAMAAGIRERSGVNVAVSVTGIAGPGGGSPAKPVGLVWFGLATGEGVTAVRRVFAGRARAHVRAGAVDVALRLVIDAL